MVLVEFARFIIRILLPSEIITPPVYVDVPPEPTQVEPVHMSIVKPAVVGNTYIPTGTTHVLLLPILRLPYVLVVNFSFAKVGLSVVLTA